MTFLAFFPLKKSLSDFLSSHSPFLTIICYQIIFEQIFYKTSIVQLEVLLCNIISFLVLKVDFSWKGFRGKVDEKSEKAAILKTLPSKSYLYCFIWLHITKFKITSHNFKKKWAFLACFSSIFPLNKEEKWMKNRILKTLWKKKLPLNRILEFRTNLIIWYL